jgi:hypothetical protein
MENIDEMADRRTFRMRTIYEFSPYHKENTPSLQRQTN